MVTAPRARTSDLAALRPFIGAARRATLATIRADGRPRLVPISFVLDESTDELTLYSAIDEKPKRTADPLQLGRVRDIIDRPMATVLVDRWDEDWARLAWVRLDCRAEVLPPSDHGGAPHSERERAIAALRAKYPQYAGQRLEERPLIRLDCTIGASWGDPAAGPPGSEASESDVEAM